MANSASPASSSQLSRSRQSSIDDRPHSPTDDVPVEVLVEHLLAAKRSLSSMNLVLRANDLATRGRLLHEEAVILSAQTAFLRRAIDEQVRILQRIRKGMTRAYESGKKDFKNLLRTLDAANNKLEATLRTLRETVVESVFRPEGEQPKSLIDFVDEKSVEGVRNSLKESVVELQAAQTSFDGDLLRFENDLRALKKAMASSPSSSPPSPSSSAAYQPIPHLLAALTNHSHAMAEHLASLTRHFDMCVTAVRTTEGGAALALRKAAEVTQSQGGGDPVSISGVIAEQDSHMADLEPMSAEERAEVVQVVVQDAPEVDEVVAELTAVLHHMEGDFETLRDRADGIRASYLSTVAAFHALEDVGSRLRSYVAAEAEYADRRENERRAIFKTLGQMDELRVFYEGYVGAYESLMLEVERRRSVQDKIHSIWRKAKENVNRLVDADVKEREIFRQEIGEFLPEDLWFGMNDPVQRWDVVPVDDPGETGDPSGGRESTPVPEKHVVDTARERPARGKDTGTSTR